MRAFGDTLIKVPAAEAEAPAAPEATLKAPSRPASAAAVEAAAKAKPAPTPPVVPPLPTFGGREPATTFQPFKFELWRFLELRSFYSAPRTLAERIAFHRELWNLEYLHHLAHPQKSKKRK